MRHEGGEVVSAPCKLEGEAEGKCVFENALCYAGCAVSRVITATLKSGSFGDARRAITFYLLALCNVCGPRRSRVLRFDKLGRSLLFDIIYRVH